MAVNWLEARTLQGDHLQLSPLRLRDAADDLDALGDAAAGEVLEHLTFRRPQHVCAASRAFDELGAERVVWHTDIRDVRSQEAIERLGASKERVLRHHRIRPDGSWRDTVEYSMLSGEWPAARIRLLERTAPAAAAPASA